MTKTPIAVLISGRGSNMNALIEACARPDYPARIALVMSNNPDAPGLETARLAGLTTLAIDHRLFREIVKGMKRQSTLPSQKPGSK